MSSDRLFRVRSKQPYSNPSTDIRHISHDLCADLPCISDTVVVGDMCVFEKVDHWEVGRILQFAYCEERKLSAYQYTGSTAQVQEKGLRVLCSWFKNSSDGLYKMFASEHHAYYPLSKYVCTLTYQCFVQHGNEADFSLTKQSTISMTSIQEFNLTVECKEFIVQHICGEKEVAQTTEPISRIEK